MSRPDEDDDAPGPAGPDEIKDVCMFSIAAYKFSIARKVIFLRRVRDNVLKKTRGGSLFVQAYECIYYKFSPRVASVMDQNPAFKTFMRIMIVEPIVRFLQVIFRSLPRIKHIYKKY